MVNRSRWVRRGLYAALLAIPLACTNNPFNPKSELVVTSVTAGGAGQGAFAGLVGIALDQSVNPAVYVYSDPQITVKSGSKQPEAYLDTALISITLGQTKLPTKKTPVVIYIAKGGSYTGIVPVLHGDSDVRNAVFPNNTPTRGQEGIARVTLLGKDKNGNEISTDFTTPLSFMTLTSAASASPGASAAPVAAPSTPASPVPAPTPAPPTPAVTPARVGP
jgi:hypothetical protein